MLLLNNIILRRAKWVWKSQVHTLPCLNSHVGIFFKYDVEPLQVTIVHGHISTYRFLMKLIALVGGVVVCTEWAYKGFDAIIQRRENRRSSSGDGLLNGVLEKGG